MRRMIVDFFPDMGIYGDLVHGKWKKNEKAPHRGRGNLGELVFIFLYLFERTQIYTFIVKKQ